MEWNKYLGHPSQACGVDEVMLTKGRGKGMNLLQVRNGKGLQFALLPDRAMDIARMCFEGVNMEFFSPAGYVAPAYFDKDGGFLNSFTAGFLTTCGLDAAGGACEDDGVVYPTHGRIANLPCNEYSYHETENEIIIDAEILDGVLDGAKLTLARRYICSKTENVIIIKDKVQNLGSKRESCMFLYHMNMGYPLLSESARLYISEKSVEGYDDYAKSVIDKRLEIEPPTPGAEESCYFYDLNEKDGVSSVGIFNPDINKGLKISFPKKELGYFTQWKMMGDRQYALGLEPANCYPSMRKKMKEDGTLMYLEPEETFECWVKIEFSTDEEKIKNI